MATAMNDAVPNTPNIAAMERAETWLKGWLAEQGGRALSRDAKIAGAASGHRKKRLQQALRRSPQLQWENDPNEECTWWVLRSSCCDGTGYADYAAVPCPNPDCPVRRPRESRS